MRTGRALHHRAPEEVTGLALALTVLSELMRRAGAIAARLAEHHHAPQGRPTSIGPEHLYAAVCYAEAEGLLPYALDLLAVAARTGVLPPPPDPEPTPVRAEDERVCCRALHAACRSQAPSWLSLVTQLAADAPGDSFREHEALRLYAQLCRVITLSGDATLEDLIRLDPSSDDEDTSESDSDYETDSDDAADEAAPAAEAPPEDEVDVLDTAWLTCPCTFCRRVFVHVVATEGTTMRDWWGDCWDRAVAP